MGDSIDDSSCIPEFTKIFFEVYNRVFLYCSFSIYERLFSKKELNFMFYDSNLNNFQKMTQFEIENLKPLTEEFFISYRKKLRFFSVIWELLKTQRGSLFVKYDFDGFSPALEASRRDLQKLKESGISLDSQSYGDHLYKLNVFRKSLIESLAARYTLVKVLKNLKNFNTFEDIVLYTIFVYDQYNTQLLFQLVCLQNDLANFHKTK